MSDFVSRLENRNTYSGNMRNGFASPASTPSTYNTTSPLNGNAVTTTTINNTNNTNGNDATAATEKVEEPIRVCFNVCKKEQFHPNKGYKQMSRYLRQSANVEVNKEAVTLDRLMPYDIVVFAAPQEKLNEDDLATIREYVSKGGSVMMLFGDGHGGQYSYLNETFSEWFDVTLNEDCVVRTVLHKYLHPKEVCVTNGVINRAINAAAGKKVFGMSSHGIGQNEMNGVGHGASSYNGMGFSTATNGLSTNTNMNNGVSVLGSNGFASATAMQQIMRQQELDEVEAEANAPSSLVFVYPHGLTLNVEHPAIPLLSSGFMAYPLNRPIAVCYEHPHEVEGRNGRLRRGKLLLIGSALTFEDQWIGKEENDKLMRVLFDYLNHKVALNQIDADEPDISDYQHLPDTAALAERLRVAFNQQDELPRDFNKLFDLDTFKIDTDKIPDVLDAYEKVNVKSEPLNLIPPEFQTPLPPVKPAVFDPIHQDPPAPALDLYDLDEEFAPQRVRLSQLTNKCKPEDLEFYIIQAAEVLGVTKRLRSPRNRDPRALLDHVFQHIVKCKKSNVGGFDGSINSNGMNADRAHQSNFNDTNPNNQNNKSNSILSGETHAFGANMKLGRVTINNDNNDEGGMSSSEKDSAEPSSQQRKHVNSHAEALHLDLSEPGIAAAAAAASGMTRLLRVDCDARGGSNNTRSNSHNDPTPFDENPHWTLQLEANFQQGLINGSLLLHEDSIVFPSQEVRIEGDIKQPGERDYPMEWGVVLNNVHGEQVFYVFMAAIQGNQLRGVCEKGGNAGVNTRNFLYALEEL